LAAVGNGHLVDTVALGEVDIVIGIPHVGASGDGGRNSGRIRERLETGSSGLGGILALAAGKLGGVNTAAHGSRCLVLTDTLGEVEIVVGVPGVGTSGSGGGGGGRSGQHAVALAAGLAGEGGVTARELGCISHASLSVLVGGRTPAGEEVSGVSGVIQNGGLALATDGCSGGAMETDGEGNEAYLKYFHYVPKR
jgi:hypothetical protein